MKRFYKMVTMAALDDGGYAVHLDGRPVMTPARTPLRAPNAAVAEALMREWAAQGETIVPDDMPITQIMTTAIDRAIPQRAVITAEILNYLDTDLVCYPAAEPEELVRLQDERWESARQWFAQKTGAALKTTTGLAAIRQDHAAHDAARAMVADMDDLRFTVCQICVAMTGSLVLALGFMEGALDADKLFAAMHAEEDHKAALYNEDFYGRAPHQEKREGNLRCDLTAASEFLLLLDQAQGA